jgi:hypothetical protein
MAAIRRLQGDATGIEALECLAERYERLPTPAQDEEEGALLVELIDRYVASLAETGKGADKPAPDIVEVWLAEAHDALDEGSEQRLPWARSLMEVIRWSQAGPAAAHPGIVSGAVEALRRQGEPLEAKELLDLMGQEVPKELQILDWVLGMEEDINWDVLVERWRPVDRAAAVETLRNVAERLTAD